MKPNGVHYSEPERVEQRIETLRRFVFPSMLGATKRPQSDGLLQPKSTKSRRMAPPMATPKPPDPPRSLMYLARL